MSDIEYYASLLEDRVRLPVFLEAIRQAVKPGDRVLEIGCGVGTYAIEASKAGAAEVHAVDFSALAIALAREMGAETGSVRLIEARVEQIALAQPVDVVIFEDFSGFAFAPGMRVLFDHVRSRLARPGARYVPARVELFAAPAEVELPKLAAPSLPFSAEGLALLRKRARNFPVSKALKAEALMAPGARIGTLSMEAPIPKHAVYSGGVRCGRTAAATGLAGWTRIDFAGGQFVDNAPGMGGTWRNFLFPFEEPLPCRAGEELEMSIEAATGPGPKGLIWRWSLRGSGGSREGCSLNAMPGSLDLLRRGSLERVPVPAARKEALAEVCRLIDGKRSVQEIARMVYNRYAGFFADEREAQDFVFGLLDAAAGFIEDRT